MVDLFYTGEDVVIIAPAIAIHQNGIFGCLNMRALRYMSCVIG